MQRWARAYRDSVYHAAIETNNGTEALNKILKYKYLPKLKHMTLSHVISNITSEFLPALHYKYVFKNFKQTDLYRSYNPSVVPSYLQGRPKQTILHCLHRKASSNKFTLSDVSQVSPNCGKFEVKGKHNVDFGSRFSDPYCSCKDWTAYHLPCKHFFAVFKFFSEWGWEKLPSSYLTSPYLSLDNQELTRYFNSEQNFNEIDNATPEANPNPSLSNEIPRKVKHLSTLCFNN